MPLTRRQPIDPERADAWHYEVLRRDKRRCINCGGKTWPVQAHHVIKQQRLRYIADKLGLRHDDLLWDPRIGVAACGDCHPGQDLAFARWSITVLPPDVWEFAAEYRCEHELEKEYR